MTDAAATVRQLLGRTEYLAAFDVADRALADQPDDPVLEHLAILAAARAGATDIAAERLHRSGLLERAAEMPVALAEDVLALDARIAKDRALAAPLEQRAGLARVAAAQYERVFARFGRTYTGVNAATMWRVAGDRRRSQQLATEVIALLEPVDAAVPIDYWAKATLAEALLLLGDASAATNALRLADRVGDDLAARASTRRQLMLLCEIVGVDPSLLDALPAPMVLHYCGHLPTRRSTRDESSTQRQGDDEHRCAKEIETFIARHGSVIAHGSLAAGADLLIAEAVLRAGGSLQVFLPFPREDFVETSVIQAGGDWLPRFDHCFEQASSVNVATAARHGDDDAAYSYCSQIAMGSAVIRARFMASRAEQLAVWDGREQARDAGTAADVRRWRAAGLSSTVIPIESTSRPRPAPHRATVERKVKAMLFADVKGFSKLLDEHVPAFVSDVLGPLAAVLDQHAVEFRNGWGDALFVVLDDILVAADVAIRLQETMADIDLEAVGLPPGLAVRIGGHAGPVFVLRDPVRQEVNFFGEHVTRAARIEPVAPPGAVFVTEAFAALLALRSSDEFVCEYVGQVPTAKSYGSMPMYQLRRHPARSPQPHRP